MFVLFESEINTAGNVRMLNKCGKHHFIVYNCNQLTSNQSLSEQTRDF